MDVDRKVKITKGYILSIGLILIAAYGWIPGYDFHRFDSIEVILILLMKIGAFGGMMMFAISLFLSARFKFFDSLFGGLDKVYLAHRFFGTASIALLLIHPVCYTIFYLHNEGFDNIINHFLQFRSWAFTLGRISLYGLILIGVWSIVWNKVKHQTFISIHKWLGAFFVIGALHAFLSGGSTVLNTNSFMYWYLLICTIIASLSYIHYTWLKDFLHPHFNYSIASTKLMAGNVWQIKLKPKYRIINFKPGQFMYLSFLSLSDRDYHPFSVASSKVDSTLTFYIKQLGDMTSDFDQLKVGDTVLVKGPYGGFTFENHINRSKQLWIGAGIGVTPFLSKAKSLSLDKKIDKVEMIYAVAAEHEAFAKKQLQEIEDQCDVFNFTTLAATKFGRLSLMDIADNLGGINDYSIYICGPPAMMKAFVDQAEQMGIGNQIFLEEFTI